MYWDAVDRDSFATVKGEKALHVVQGRIQKIQKEGAETPTTPRIR